MDLPPLPSDEEIIEAVRAICEEKKRMAARARKEGYFYVPREATANDVGHHLGVKGARRHGNGAVKGTWTGYMAPALRLSPRLASLTRRGLLARRSTEDYRYEYRLPYGS